MRPAVRALLRHAVLPALALAAAACAASPAGRPDLAPATRRNFDIISREEILQRTWANALDLVTTLRPQWVRQRGPDSLTGQATPVQAYLDGSRLANLAALSNISTAGLHSVEWVDGLQATARWGLDHGQGAIVLHTRAR